jgi:inorganic pyrophosphatase|tara:strand:- start:1350 stop:1874 length:525 start_codon:yes stop_codon:yes gene_type:complete
MDYKKIPTGTNAPETVNCVIEIPRDTNQKYEFDSEIRAFRLDRILNTAMRYPANYGFIPSTLGEDGDPLDMLTYNWTPMAMGCVVRCHVVGVLEMEDDGEMDWKIIGRPTTSPKKSIMDIHNINESFLAQAKNFFQHYKDLESKEVKIGNWLPRDKAIDIVKDAIERYNNNKNI